MIKKYLLFLLTLLLSACAPAPRLSPSDPWVYANLRAVEDASSSNPAYDLVAVYNRTAGSDLQIRLDLLDFDFTSPFDLIIALDTQPGGSTVLPLEVTPGLAWDILVVLPAVGQPMAFDTGQAEALRQARLGPAPVLWRDLPKTHLPRRDFIPRQVRDPWLDSVIASLNRGLIPGIQPVFRFQVFLAPPDRTFPVDSLGPLRSDSLPPPRAPLLLAFWNTFPAYTPAQAFRRWDGAHTGPFGERHGLYLLLKSIKRHKIPVALADLKMPTNLSALDYMAALPLIQRLAAERLLILPDSLPGTPARASPPATPPENIPTDNVAYAGVIASGMLPDWGLARAAADSRQVAQVFGLPASIILYAPKLPAQPPDGYPLIFTPLEADRLVRWKDRVLIPIPSQNDLLQVTTDGPNLELRRRLLEGAAHGELIILAEDFTNSPWGDPTISEASLRYIAQHPWIHPLRQDDLLALPATNLYEAGILNDPSLTPSPLPLPFTCLGEPGPGQPECPSPPQNHITEAAWQATLALLSPLPPEHTDLPWLRANYAGQVGVLLEAARWVENPIPRNDCDTDLDLDGEEDCILASQNFFAVIEPSGARLVYLFARDSGGTYQLIAPTWQFIAGLGDPSTWVLDSGEAADPAAIPGAFTDSARTWHFYHPDPSSGKITFLSTEIDSAKTYTLTASGIQVEYRLAPPLTTQIPLALDPWARFTQGWGDRYISSQHGPTWSWELAGGPHLEITTSGRLAAHTFTASRPYLGVQEDPNFNYPRGHYLPFPMALVEVQGEKDFYIQIDLLMASGHISRE